MRRCGCQVLALAYLASLWPLPAAADTARVKTAANIRTQASAQSALLTSVPAGTRLEVLGREGEWYKVRTAAGTGYVFGKLVDVEASPAAAGPAEPAPAASEGPSPAERAGLAIDHKPVACIVADHYSRFDACFDAAERVSRARLNFRADGTLHWYYTDLKAAESCFSGTLPKAKRSTKKVDYYIDVVDTSFAESRTPEYAPVVVGSAMECKDEMVAASVVGTRSVIVGASPGAPVIPSGFASAGIVAIGSSTAAATTSSSAAAAGGAGAAGAAGGGLSATTIGLIAGGVALAGVGIAVAAGGGKPDPADQDNDHDGFTPRQGDCNDNNSAINPNGKDAFVNGRFAASSFTCPNGSPSSVQLVLLADGQNNKCVDLSISAASVKFTVVAVNNTTDKVGDVVTLDNQPFAPKSIAAGSRATVQVTVAATCTNLNPQPGNTDLSADVTFVTSAGTFTVKVPNAARVVFPLR